MPGKSALLLLVEALLLSICLVACTAPLPARPSSGLAAVSDALIPSARIQSLPDHFKP